MKRELRNFQLKQSNTELTESNSDTNEAKDALLQQLAEVFFFSTKKK